ncbi:oligosaccharide flippase family protein [uncultured Megasphaera sp.]|uniref:lipopolysaccharide biosynthesis protein n=1 Tax=uncultured Megasphaera sp. TaxID=165188 RepID=UPI0025DE2F56|nr:oligosaccharide flippase family protein [uncultured Megasphaera sp.]
MLVKKILTKYNNLPVQVRASLWFLICSFLQKGISVITVPIFTRLLTTAEYGQFNVFNSWLGIVGIFVSLNLSYGVYQQGLIKFDKERAVFSSSLQGLTLLMVLCWTVVYGLFYYFWNQLFSLTTVQMLAMLILIWTTAAFSFWSTEQRVYYKYRTLVVITLTVSLAKPLLGIFLVLHATDKVTARILGLVLVELIAYTGCFIVQMKAGKTFYSAKFWKYALCYNLPLIPHYLSQVVLNNTDRIMIENMVGPSEAGIYSLAYSIALIMTLFNISLRSTMGPWMYQKIKDKKIKDITPIGYLCIGIVVAVNLLLIALAPEAVSFFAPPAYYEAIYCIPPVAMGVLFMFAYDLFAGFAFYYEKTRAVMLTSVGGAILNIVLNYFGIKIFGYIAAAYTTLICYICYDVCHYTLMSKICNLYLDGVKPYTTKTLILISICFLSCGFIMLFTYDYPLLRYGIIVVASIVMFFKKNRIKAVVMTLKNVKQRKI